MAKKTKAQSTLAELTRVRKALCECQTTIDWALATGIKISPEAECLLRKAEAHLVSETSRLRGLLGLEGKSAKANVRTAPQKRPRKVLSGRKHVASRVQTSPRRNRKASTVGTRARVQRKQAGKEFFHEHELPH